MNIVISGSSRGIGYEVALQMAKQGHQVLAIARNEDLLNELKNHSKNIRTLCIDLTSNQLKSKLQSLIEDWSRVDVLINNAGQLLNKSFITTELVDFESQFSSNVLTAVNLIQACNGFLKKGSHIVNITSMGGYHGSSKFSGLSAYSTSKGALSILTECLAEEYKEIGVSVNALALGAVQTEMLAKAFPDYEAPLSASEMASYIVDFSFNGKRYYNGQVLPVALGNP